MKKWTHELDNKFHFQKSSSVVSLTNPSNCDHILHGYTSVRMTYDSIDLPDNIDTKSDTMIILGNLE